MSTLSHSLSDNYREQGQCYFLVEEAVRLGPKAACVLDFFRRYRPPPLILKEVMILCHNLFTEKALKQNILKKLVEANELNIQEMTSFQCAQIVKSKNRSRYQIDENEFSLKICEWCHSHTFHLQEHHFPIPKKNKGKDVVRICATCHQDYHYLKDYKKYFLNEGVVA